ncbi:MAG TPA: biopolymer transporter ExbD [Gammaproteobacteria bacterium]|nr:biopolymer transporter ExbD [Gammaproteobacteria bacterium]
MRFRQSIRQDPDINLTPLIDVVFLLLIFFMVSTTFTRESEITVDLPEASVTEQPREERPLEIIIDAQGRFYVNQQLVVNKKLETLVQALKKAMGEGAPPPLVINADAQTPHQYVVTAMDAARVVGITHLSLATKQKR